MSVFVDVKNFMDAVGQSGPEKPVDEYVYKDEYIPSMPIINYNDGMSLYKYLIEEEDNEFWKAQTLGEQADGIIDGIWVRIGYLVAAGIDPQPLWDAVRAANMTKSTGPICEKTGKRLKPPGFQHPDIAALIQKQREVKTCE